MNEAETLPQIICACCGDPIEYNHVAELWKEAFMGYVCPECKYRCKAAVAYLKHHGMKTCEHRVEGMQ